MKKVMISALILSLSLGFSLQAQDYYWVGDGGNWSDLSHWATTSGGDIKHTQLPGPENNVIFDANSFTMPNQEVILDLEEVFCKDFIAEGVLFQPEIKALNFYDRFLVFGNFSMDSGINRNFRSVEIMNSTEAHISTGGLHLGGFLQLKGGGYYHLHDSTSVDNLYVISSALNSNDNAIFTRFRFYAYSGNPVVELGNSNVYTPSWLVFQSSQIDAENATIYFGSEFSIFGDFFGGGHHYHRVVFIGDVNIRDDNTFDIFEAKPGADIELRYEYTQTAEEFVLHGNSQQMINIRSSQPGTQATLFKSSGTVNASYLSIQDNGATGGAEFNAENSIDLGNNSGWNISESLSKDYFWVGGGGDWENLSHWATSSGGSEFHSQAPTAIDHVFFDENSGLANNELVRLNGFNWNVGNLTFSNINASALITQNPGGALNIYGDFISEGGVRFNLRRINFLSDEEANISIETESFGPMSELQINSSSVVKLLSTLEVRNLVLNSGAFNANGQDLQVIFSFEMQANSSCQVDLSGINFRVRQFNNSSPEGLLNVEGTKITCLGTFHSNNQEYYHLTFDGRVWGFLQRVYGSFSVEELVIEPNTTLELRAGRTITAGSITAIGNANEPIEIFSHEEGVEAFFHQSSGTVNGRHLILRDNHAVGGAEFLAYDSELHANVEGWQSLTPVHEIRAEEISIYPNPFTESINVKGYAGEILNIFTLDGRLIESIHIDEGWNHIPLHHLNSGNYLLDIQGEKRRGFGQVVRLGE